MVHLSDKQPIRLKKNTIPKTLYYLLFALYTLNKKFKALWTSWQNKIINIKVLRRHYPHALSLSYNSKK